VLGFVASFALLTYFIVAACTQAARTASAVALATGLGFYLVSTWRWASRSGSTLGF